MEIYSIPIDWTDATEDFLTTGSGTFGAGGIGLYDNSGEHYLIIKPTDDAYDEDSTLTIDLDGGDRELRIRGDFVILDNWFNQNVRTNAAPTHTGMTFHFTYDYLFTNRGGTALAIQNQTDNIDTVVELFTKLGDGLSDSVLTVCGYGTPASYTNRHLLQVGWFSRLGYEIRSVASGNQDAQALAIYTGDNTTQLVLATDGDIAMSGDLGVTGGVTTSSLTFDMTMDYIFSDRGGRLVLQSQATSQPFEHEYFTYDGDSTDQISLNLYAMGTPAQGDHLEVLLFGFWPELPPGSGVTNSWAMWGLETGDGELRPFRMEFDGSHNYTQFVLGTDGNVTMSGDLGVTGAVTGSNLDVAGWDAHIIDNSQAHTDYLINNGDDETSGALTVGSLITTGGDPEQTGKFLTGNAGNTVFSFSGGNFDIRAGDGSQSDQNVMRVTSAGDFDFKAGNLITTGEINFRDTDISIGSTLTEGVLDITADGAIDIFYNNAAIGDGVDGQSLNIHRRAVAGYNYISLYVDKDRRGLIGISGDDDLLQLATNALTVNGSVTADSFTTAGDITTTAGTLYVAGAIVHHGNVDTQIVFGTDYFYMAAAGHEMARFVGSGKVIACVFNNDGEDIDFIVKGDTDDNALYVDASTDRTGIGVADPHSKLEVAGAISSATLTITTSSDALDVSGVNTVFINITGDIILGGLVGGVDGQIVHFAIIGNFTNHVRFKHAEGIANSQDFINHTSGDEDIDHGGCIYVCNGTDWYDISHAKHV